MRHEPVFDHGLLNHWVFHIKMELGLKNMVHEMLCAFYLRNEVSSVRKVHVVRGGSFWWDFMEISVGNFERKIFSYQVIYSILTLSSNIYRFNEILHSTWIYCKLLLLLFLLMTIFFCSARNVSLHS